MGKLDSETRLDARLRELGFSEKVIAKDTEATQDPEHAEVWWVRGTTPGKKYRVQFGDGWATCTCTFGMNHPGKMGCYHMAAALRGKWASEGE